MLEPERFGCFVGAIVCDTSDLQIVFDALRTKGLSRPRAVKSYKGRKAVHLTIEGASLLCTGRTPTSIQELLNKGCIEFVPGLRIGAQLYKGLARSPNTLSDTSRKFTFIDLFAGIGGFRRALEPLGGSCVFSSEIDVDCQETYARNFGGQHLFGDITEIASEDFPVHDILTAGFPCQSFSRRGDRQGFEDPRGELFHEIPRVLRACKPQAFILENVWNVQFVDSGQESKTSVDENTYGDVFKHILSCLHACGYTVRTKALSAQGWVPQKRERLYFVGIRNELAEEAFSSFQWPCPPGCPVVGDVLEPAGSSEARNCELTDTQWQNVQKSSTWKRGGHGLRIVDPQGIAATLTASYKASYATTAELVGPTESGLQRPRFYTRRECARLMGFPDEHDLGNPNAPNRAYHQLGNAVCPPLIQAIARNLVCSLKLTAFDDDVDNIQSRISSSNCSRIALTRTADVAKITEHFESGSLASNETSSNDIDNVFSDGKLLEAGEFPPLASQLEALTIEQLADRLLEFGESVRQPHPEEFVQGFKASRRAELVASLCSAYAARNDRQPRLVVHDKGVALPSSDTAELLEIVRMMDWKENVRQGVNAQGYVVLKRPHDLTQTPRWHEHDPRSVRRKIWHLAEKLLASTSEKAALHKFTAIAVSKNFRGSPHVDKNDIAAQYAFSLGDFSEGGGQLCVEESAFVVRAFDTRGRMVCIDGRFPHWVSGYVGERYSFIFYRSSGESEPRLQAVHEA